jgi:hypothetical protein
MGLLKNLYMMLSPGKKSLKLPEKKKSEFVRNHLFFQNPGYACAVLPTMSNHTGT